MQINKKLSTGLIVTLLALSTIAIAIPSAFAVVANLQAYTAMGAPITGGTVGQSIRVGGDSAAAWALVQFYWDSPANKIGEVYADGAGDFLLTGITVPEDVAGNHQILVNDGTGNVALNSNINPKLTISATKALPGDSLAVTGSGFGDEVPVGIYLGTITSVVTEAVADDDLDESPVVKGTVVLTVDVTVDGDIGGTAVTGPATLTVTDDGEGVLSGTLSDVVVDDGVVVEDGEVDVTIVGTINYATGGIALSASGVDSAAGTGTVLNIAVTIDAIDAAYQYAQYEVTPLGGITTSAAGSFAESILVPAIPVLSYGNYLDTAIDTDGNTANPTPVASLSVDYYILVNPISGPAGITVTLSGRIPANTVYEIRLDTTTIATGTSAADTTYTQTHQISSFLSKTAHTFYVVWGGTNTRSATFTVTESPRMALSSTSGMAGQVITISSVPGYPFSAGADLTLYINGAVVNGTTIDDRFGPTVAFGPASGTFTDLEFTIPALAPGVYAIELVDSYGASTGTMYTFTVVPTPETAVSMVGTVFYPGDTLAWSFSSTDTVTVAPTVTVRSPTGAVWWQGVWATTTSGPMTTVLYQNQLFGGAHATLPSNAPLGSWNWTAVYSTGSAANVKATGLFSVMAAATLDTVTTDIADLVDDISDISDDVATINTNINNLEDLIDALEVTVDIPELTTLTNDVASLKVSVSALDAVVTAVAGDVATVDTKIGTLTGTITGIEGNIATIETDVGTLQADISDVEANVDSTPAWIAVVLALVAAVAAIFAVITIRQKIAG
ncbi:MAG: hypothetical protein CW691_09820 [Candidatus Bathyarchaeum sp.]|nr:MAG: hypothetical protein CW691_09820 [Candidatus Bathyarchaeum sp.]